jgi:nitrite reductase/ring-hydroxylating ferredoxin subunit
VQRRERDVIGAKSISIGDAETVAHFAPSATSFSRSPSGWYFLGRARDIAAGPAPAKIAGRAVVVFRTAAGEIAVLDAQCSHQGADLSRGKVVADTIQCPFHSWRFDTNGKCTAASGLCSPPEFARQRSYPVVERHGLLFAFNGPRPMFDLPFFWECDPGEFVAGRPFRFIAECPWYVLASNGFDVAHFLSVHDRRMLEPPVVDEPHPFARRLRVLWEVTGDSVFDRLLRRFVGSTVDVTITNWGGTLTLVTGRFRHTTSYIYIASGPYADERTEVNVIVFAQRRRPAWFDAATRDTLLALRRLFTRAFLRDDIERLVGIRYQPDRFTAADAEMAKFYCWLALLPQENPLPCREEIGEAS